MTATIYYSNNPPVKNEAFTYYFSVIDQSDTNVSKANPTLASGDFKTEGDGGTPANCNALPSAINSGKVLSHTLSANEMNNNTVYVIGSDAADDEWQDVLIVIYTVTEGSMSANVAISGTVAQQVATGRLSVRSHHTFSQSITSTTTSDLSTATKVWWTIKTAKSDTDNNSIIFVESGSGLIRYSGSAYASASSGNGSITTTGSSGDWNVALKLDEIVTGSMATHTGYYSEVKALVSNNTVSVWDGQANINQGLVQAIV